MMRLCIQIFMWVVFLPLIPLMYISNDAMEQSLEENGVVEGFYILLYVISALIGIILQAFYSAIMIAFVMVITGIGT